MRVGQQSTLVHVSLHSQKSVIPTLLFKVKTRLREVTQLAGLVALNSGLFLWHLFAHPLASRSPRGDSHSTLASDAFTGAGGLPFGYILISHSCGHRQLQWGKWVIHRKMFNLCYFSESLQKRRKKDQAHPTIQNYC